MASIGARDGEFGLQIAPMLDILFVLLLFFMVAAGSMKIETSISTQLPGNFLSPVVPVNLTIDADGTVNLNGEVYDVAESSALPVTVARLKAMAASTSSLPVLIVPAPSTREQRVVDVLNACTAAGVRNVAFGSSGG